MKKNKTIVLVLVVSLFIGTLKLYAHQVRHEEKDNHEKNESKVSTPISADGLQEINQRYLKSIKPIFQAKCFDCHSTKTHYPWYHSIPGIKQLIDNDIKEGLEHVDMTNDFPFKGHGSPKEDLEAIKETVQENSMPPLSYRLMHWGSELTKKDIETIRSWLRQSEIILNADKNHD